MPSRVPTPPEVSRLPSEVALDDAQPTVAAKGTRDVTVRLPRLGSETEDINERITLIAHDLKTPLSIILLETEMLGVRLSAVQSAAIQKSLDRIAQNAAYIDRLVADLLDLDVVDLELRLERVDLAILLREVIDRAVSTVDRNRVQLDVRCVAHVHGDRHRLERVVANFLSNALKYSTAPVTVVLELAGTSARVTVIDQGHGLTPEQAQLVFDRYRRGPTRGRDGYGLGLYISRKIIDAHGGRIGVESEPGAGSRFFFELAVMA